MALDPNIALQVRPFKMDSPVNAMAQMYQLQGAQQANQLGAMQMAEYERTRQEEEGARNFLTGADLKSPQARQELATRFGKTGIAYAKTLAEQEASALEQKVKQLDYTTKVTDAAASIYGTVKDQASYDAAKPRLAALGGDPKTLPVNYDPNFIRQEMLAATKVKDQLAMFSPKPMKVDRADGTTIFLDENPNSPTFGKEVMPKQAAGMTPFQTESLQVSKNQAKTSAGQLGLAREKFAFEQANPGLSIQEDPSGLVAVNLRTGVATPVVYGQMGFQAAPAAAPVAGPSVMRQPGVGMPGQRTPAIPGMSSVLDQTAAPAATFTSASGVPVAGTRVMGKGDSLTEGERKSASLLQRLRGSQNQLTQALLDDPKAAGPQAFATAVGKLSTTGANLLNSEARQRVEAAQLDIIDAALTLGTGAAYTKEQLEGYRQAYFPAYGDEPATIADKQARLKNVISAANIAAGKAAKLVPIPAPASTGSDVRSAADKILEGKK